MQIKLLIKAAVFILLLFSTQSVCSQSYEQYSINGDTAYCIFGNTVASSDKWHIAVSSPGFNGNRGSVKVYRRYQNQWIQKGFAIQGTDAGEQSGFSLSFPDSNTIAVGSPFMYDLLQQSGSVIIYQWSGTEWIQKGQKIGGIRPGEMAGKSVSMPDESTIAIGSPYNDSAGPGAGLVRVFKWNGIQWLASGQIIIGDTFENAGYCVYMPDTNTLCVGYRGHDSLRGMVRVFKLNQGLWGQRGSDLEGDAPGDQFGSRVFMPDTKTLVIGAPYFDGFYDNIGIVKIYRLMANDWVLSGSPIKGYLPHERFGMAIDMPDTATLAVSAPFNGEGSYYGGKVSIYKHNGTKWYLRDSSVKGNRSGELCGYDIVMPDSATLVAGCPNSDIKGSNTGRIRIFSLNNTITGVSRPDNDEILLYPNPAGENVMISIKSQNKGKMIVLRESSGKEITRSCFTSEIKLNMPQYPGFYFIEVWFQNNEYRTFKVLRI